MMIPAVVRELLGVIAGLGAGVLVGRAVHRWAVGPVRTGAWRNRWAFWLAWFVGALVGQSLSARIAGSVLPWRDLVVGAAGLAAIFTLVYVWKFRSGVPRHAPQPPP
jgi:hypothetical protein